jgi:hypothetical protein
MVIPLRPRAAFQKQVFLEIIERLADMVKHRVAVRLTAQRFLEGGAAFPNVAECQKAR